MRWHLALLLLISCSLTACIGLTTTRPTVTHLTPADTLAVSIEFDRVPLAPLFLTAFREQGLPVAASKETAQILLTGAYSVTWATTQWRMNWSQFRLVRPQTGEVLLLLETGEAALVRVKTVVERMVTEIKPLYQ